LVDGKTLVGIARRVAHQPPDQTGRYRYRFNEGTIHWS
jgi:hypothetical protein